MAMKDLHQRPTTGPTKKTLDSTVALSDSDYPPVYGASPFDSLPGYTKAPAVAIIKKEGYDVTSDTVKALNLFQSPMDAFQYALYYFGVKDFFIVLMINKRQRSIYGYHVLDLTQKHSISDDIVNCLKNRNLTV